MQLQIPVLSELKLLQERHLCAGMHHCLHTLPGPRSLKHTEMASEQETKPELRVGLPITSSVTATVASEASIHSDAHGTGSTQRWWQSREQVREIAGLNSGLALSLASLPSRRIWT